MQYYPKTAEKRGLHLWKLQSTASDISPEWRERTQCSLASVLPADFPFWPQETHCPFTPPRSGITAEPPTPFLPNSSELPEGSELLTLTLLWAQSETTERNKTQACWEWGSSKYKLMRRNPHTVHLQSSTLTLCSPFLAPTKDLFFVIHQSHQTLGNGVSHSLLFLAAAGNFSWLRGLSNIPGTQPSPRDLARKDGRWNHH